MVDESLVLKLWAEGHGRDAITLKLKTRGRYVARILRKHNLRRTRFEALDVKPTMIERTKEQVEESLRVGVTMLRAAKQLQVGYSTLKRLMRLHGIDHPRTAPRPKNPADVRSIYDNNDGDSPHWKARIVRVTDKRIEFELLSSIRPKPSDIDIQQAQMGYHPRGYGGPSNLIIDQLPSHGWRATWSCWGSCE